MWRAQTSSKGSMDPVHDLIHIAVSKFALATCRSLSFGSLTQQGSGGGSSGPPGFRAGSKICIIIIIA